MTIERRKKQQLQENKDEIYTHQAEKMGRQCEEWIIKLPIYFPTVFILQVYSAYFKKSQEYHKLLRKLCIITIL